MLHRHDTYFTINLKTLPNTKLNAQYNYLCFHVCATVLEILTKVMRFTFGKLSRSPQTVEVFLVNTVENYYVLTHFAQEAIESQTTWLVI